VKQLTLNSSLAFHHTFGMKLKAHIYHRQCPLVEWKAKRRGSEHLPAMKCFGEKWQVATRGTADNA